STAGNVSPCRRHDSSLERASPGHGHQNIQKVLAQRWGAHCNVIYGARTSRDVPPVAPRVHRRASRRRHAPLVSTDGSGVKSLGLREASEASDVPLPAATAGTLAYYVR